MALQLTSSGGLWGVLGEAKCSAASVCFNLSSDAQLLTQPTVVLTFAFDLTLLGIDVNASKHSPICGHCAADLELLAVWMLLVPEECSLFFV